MNEGRPGGRSAPKGLDASTAGMTQEDVLLILTPLYRITHAGVASPGRPYVDYFRYLESGDTKWAEIYYDGIQVSGVRFGYDEYLVIQ